MRLLELLREGRGLMMGSSCSEACQAVLKLDRVLNGRFRSVQRGLDSESMKLLIVGEECDVCGRERLGD